MESTSSNTNAPAPSSSKILIITPEQIAKLGLTRSLNEVVETQVVVPKPKKNVRVSKITIFPAKSTVDYTSAMTPNRDTNATSSSEVVSLMKSKLSNLLKFKDTEPPPTTKRQSAELKLCIAPKSASDDDDVSIVERPKPKNIPNILKGAKLVAHPQRLSTPPRPYESLKHPPNSKLKIHVLSNEQISLPQTYIQQLKSHLPDKQPSASGSFLISNPDASTNHETSEICIINDDLDESNTPLGSVDEPTGPAVEEETFIINDDDEDEPNTLLKEQHGTPQETPRNPHIQTTIDLETCIVNDKCKTLMEENYSNVSTPQLPISNTANTVSKVTEPRKIIKTTLSVEAKRATVVSQPFKSLLTPLMFSNTPHFVIKTYSRPTIKSNDLPRDLVCAEEVVDLTEDEDKRNLNKGANLSSSSNVTLLNEANRNKFAANQNAFSLHKKDVKEDDASNELYVIKKHSSKETHLTLSLEDDDLEDAEPPVKRGKKRGKYKRKVEIEEIAPEPVIELSRSGRKRKVVDYAALSEGIDYDRRSIKLTKPTRDIDSLTTEKKSIPLGSSNSSTTKQTIKRKRGRVLPTLTNQTYEPDSINLDSEAIEGNLAVETVDDSSLDLTNISVDASAETPAFNRTIESSSINTTNRTVDAKVVVEPIEDISKNLKISNENSVGYVYPIAHESNSAMARDETVEDVPVLGFGTESVDANFTKPIENIPIDIETKIVDATDADAVKSIPIDVPTNSVDEHAETIMEVPNHTVDTNAQTTVEEDTSSNIQTDSVDTNETDILKPLVIAVHTKPGDENAGTILVDPSSSIQSGSVDTNHTVIVQSMPKLVDTNAETTTEGPLVNLLGTNQTDFVQQMPTDGVSEPADETPAARLENSPINQSVDTNHTVIVQSMPKSVDTNPETTTEGPLVNLLGTNQTDFVQQLPTDVVSDGTPAARRENSPINQSVDADQTNIVQSLPIDVPATSVDNNVGTVMEDLPINIQPESVDGNQTDAVIPLVIDDPTGSIDDNAEAAVEDSSIVVEMSSIDATTNQLSVANDTKLVSEDSNVNPTELPLIDASTSAVEDVTSQSQQYGTKCESTDLTENEQSSKPNEAVFLDKTDEVEVTDSQINHENLQSDQAQQSSNVLNDSPDSSLIVNEQKPTVDVNEEVSSKITQTHASNNEQCSEEQDSETESMENIDGVIEAVDSDRDANSTSTANKTNANEPTAMSSIFLNETPNEGLEDDASSDISEKETQQTLDKNPRSELETDDNRVGLTKTSNITGDSRKKTSTIKNVASPDSNQAETNESLSTVDSDQTVTSNPDMESYGPTAKKRTQDVTHLQNYSRMEKRKSLRSTINQTTLEETTTTSDDIETTVDSDQTVDLPRKPDKESDGKIKDKKGLKSTTNKTALEKITTNSDDLETTLDSDQIVDKESDGKRRSVGRPALKRNQSAKHTEDRSSNVENRKSLRSTTNETTLEESTTNSDDIETNVDSDQRIDLPSSDNKESDGKRRGVGRPALNRNQGARHTEDRSSNVENRKSLRSTTNETTLEESTTNSDDIETTVDSDQIVDKESDGKRRSVGRPTLKRNQSAKHTEDRSSNVENRKSLRSTTNETTLEESTTNSDDIETNVDSDQRIDLPSSDNKESDGKRRGVGRPALNRNHGAKHTEDSSSNVENRKRLRSTTNDTTLVEIPTISDDIETTVDSDHTIDLPSNDKGSEDKRRGVGRPALNKNQGAKNTEDRSSKSNVGNRKSLRNTTNESNLEEIPTISDDIETTVDSDQTIDLPSNDKESEGKRRSVGRPALNRNHGAKHTEDRSSKSNVGNRKSLRSTTNETTLEDSTKISDEIETNVDSDHIFDLPSSDNKESDGKRRGVGRPALNRNQGAKHKEDRSSNVENRNRFRSTTNETTLEEIPTIRDDIETNVDSDQTIDLPSNDKKIEGKRRGIGRPALNRNQGAKHTEDRSSKSNVGNRKSLRSTTNETTLEESNTISDDIETNVDSDQTIDLPSINAKESDGKRRGVGRPALNRNQGAKHTEDRSSNVENRKGLRSTTNETTLEEITTNSNDIETTVDSDKTVDKESDGKRRSVGRPALKRNPGVKHTEDHSSNVESRKSLRSTTSQATLEKTTTTSKLTARSGKHDKETSDEKTDIAKSVLKKRAQDAKHTEDHSTKMETSRATNPATTSDDTETNASENELASKGTGTRTRSSTNTLPNVELKPDIKIEVNSLNFDDADQVPEPKENVRKGRHSSTDPTTSASAKTLNLIFENIKSSTSVSELKKPVEIGDARKGRETRKRNRKGDVVQREPTFVLDGDNVTCAVCSEKVQMNRWTHHKLQTHNNLAWRVGEPPLDLDDHKFVVKVLSDLYKRKKPLHCDECGEVKKSVLGFLSHKSMCRKTTEEVNSLRVKCEFCGRTVLPVSFTTHLKYCKKGESENVAITKEQIVTRDIAVSRKRKAAAKAENLIKKLQHNGAMEAASSATTKKRWLWHTNFDFRPTTFLKTRFRNDIETNGNATCLFNGCNFESSDLEQVTNHVYSCDKRPLKGFTCKYCIITYDCKDDMLEHAMTNHPQASSDDDDKEFGEEENDLLDDEQEDEDDGVGEHMTTTIKPYKQSHINNVLHGIEFLLKHRICAPTTSVVYPPAKAWALKFCEQNFINPDLFSNLRTNMEWNKLDPTLISAYLPKLRHSMNTAVISSKIYVDPYRRNHEWRNYNLFESSTFTKNSSSIIFCGGPITALAWAPTPYDKTCPQFLAVTVNNDIDKPYVLGEKYSEPALIQIWNCGTLLNIPKTIDSPKLEFCIANDFGPIWCLEWCPSGCYDDLSKDPVDGSHRIGILAVGSANSHIYLYAVYLPTTTALSLSQKVRIKKLGRPTPELNLHQPDTGVVVQFLKAKGHEYVAAGYANGMVAVYNLSTTSTLLKQGRDADGVETIMPHRVVLAHYHAVTALSLYHLNDGRRWLMTGSLDRNIKYWDLDNPSVPISNFNRLIITDCVWLNHWLSAVHSFDDSCASGLTYTLALQCRNYESEQACIMHSNSRIQSLSGSEWTNGFVQGNVVGEVVGFFPHQMFCGMDNDRSYKKKRVVLGYNRLVDTSRAGIDGGGEPAGSRCEPNSYIETARRFGLVFCDMEVSSMRDFSTNMTSYLESNNSDKYYETKPNIYPMQAVNKIAFNPNGGSFCFLATGYQVGFVKISWLPFLSN